MNLSTARANIRAKEVGLRKVIGAKRVNVIKQFLGEALLLSFIGLFFALTLVSLLLPVFNNLTLKELKLDLRGDILFLAGLFVITLFTGLVSGSYPALFLSTFQPAKVLKGFSASGTKRKILRRVLVVTQFTIAIIFIIGTFIVYKQLKFIRSTDLGFNRQHILSLDMNSSITKNYQSFKNELLRDQNIVRVTSATSRPTQVGNINPVYWAGRNPDQYEDFKFIRADYDYIDTFEMELVEGRDFSKELVTDREGYIVNEEALRIMKLEEPVGKLFSIWQNRGKIIGVVKDFHSRPLHNEIEPLVITMWDNSDWALRFVFVRLRPENIPQTLSYVGKTWKKFAPNYPLEFLFLDDVFERQYRTDQRTGTIFLYFTVLAIFISCLGIFGLASYTAEQRTKEVGIRKVLGATLSNIVSLLSREFMVLLVLANMIAWPAAFILTDRLLQNYAYRTNITIWPFLLAGALAFCIALITVSYQAVKTALMDPTNALRYE
jgi:ABC-type antimicrobial peptide transport system permease subunit